MSCYPRVMLETRADGLNGIGTCMHSHPIVRSEGADGSKTRRTDWRLMCYPLRNKNSSPIGRQMGCHSNRSRD
jgi:hypothetical protein